MKGEEFIERLIAGERDFYIELEEGFNLSGHKRYPELLEICEEQWNEIIKRKIFLEEDKYNFRLSSLKGLKANYLILPGNFDGRGANFEGSELKMAFLTSGRFDKANFRNANLEDSFFSRSGLDFTNFENANLSKASLCITTCYGTNFYGAMLKDTCFYKALTECTIYERGLYEAFNNPNSFWKKISSNVRKKWFKENMHDVLYGHKCRTEKSPRLWDEINKTIEEYKWSQSASDNYKLNLNDPKSNHHV